MSIKRIHSRSGNAVPYNMSGPPCHGRLYRSKRSIIVGYRPTLVVSYVHCWCFGRRENVAWLCTIILSSAASDYIHAVMMYCLKRPSSDGAHSRQPARMRAKPDKLLLRI